MNKRFRACSLDQEFLLPPSLQDWLPEDHLARFIADVVNELDMSPIYAEYERKDGRGLSAYHPLMMTRLLLYGYCIGITSSRKIEKATYDNLAFRYLSADQHPDHDTLAAFRQEHLEALAGLFVQALRLCQKAGLVKLGNVAIDGSKIKANASTHRSVDYQKISEREQHWRSEVERLLSQAQQTDQVENQHFGIGQVADPMPDDLANAQKRLQRLQQAKTELEQEAKEQLQAVGALPLRKRGRPSKEEQSSPPPRDRSSARKKKSSANELERMPLHRAVSITSSIPTRA